MTADELAEKAQIIWLPPRVSRSGRGNIYEAWRSFTYPVLRTEDDEWIASIWAYQEGVDRITFTCDSDGVRPEELEAILAKMKELGG